MNATATKKETNLTPAFALWKRMSKEGKPYFSGKTEKGGEIRAFYNTKKKDLKEPDLIVYGLNSEGKTEKEELVALWCNTSKNGKGKYLSGKAKNGKRMVGFFNEKDTVENKQPYVRVYFAEEGEGATTPTTPKAPPTWDKNKQAPKWEQVRADEDLPF